MIDSLGWRFAPWTPAVLKVYWDQIGCEHDEVSGNFDTRSVTLRLMRDLYQVTSYIAEAMVSFCKISWRPTPSEPTPEVFARECITRPPEDDIMGLEHGYHLEALSSLVAEFPALREKRNPGALAPRSQYDR